MAAQPSNDLPKRPSQANPRAISLRLVILFVSCCAIALGLIWHWPGAVPVVAIAVVIAAVRGLTMLRAVDVEGRQAPWRIVAVLLGSLGIVSLVGATSAAAFVAVCFPLGASQFDMEGESRIATLLRAAAWLFGGAAGALAAALTLDHLWLRPLAERADVDSTAQQKERIRLFLRATVPLLGAATVGGIASIIPGVSSGAAGPHSPPAAVACFVLCLATFAVGGWLGLKAAQKSLREMSAFLGFSIGMLTCYGIVVAADAWVRQDPLFRDGLNLNVGGILLVSLIVGVGCAAMTWLAVTWAQQPD